MAKRTIKEQEEFDKETNEIIKLKRELFIETKRPKKKGINEVDPYT